MASYKMSFTSMILNFLLFLTLAAANEEGMAFFLVLHFIKCNKIFLSLKTLLSRNFGRSLLVFYLIY